MMEPVKTKLDAHGDDRGVFVELAKGGTWAQWNTSTSRPDVFRGFHFQARPHAQAKLVTLLSGRITDYCLDLETGVMFEFDLAPYDQLFVPPDFAHAFHTKETSTIVYACSTPRVVEAERAIRVPQLHPRALRSPRDAAAMTFAEWRSQ